MTPLRSLSIGLNARLIAALNVSRIAFLIVVSVPFILFDRAVKALVIDCVSEFTIGVSARTMVFHVLTRPA